MRRIDRWVSANGRRYKSRNEIAIRLARLIYMAQTRTVLPSRRALAVEFGVCERTIMRDLEACEAARVPIPIREERD